MKTTMYWTTQHLRRTACELRFAAQFWWLKQRVDFLEWRWRIEALMPHAQPIPAPVPATQGSRYAVRAL